jgi:hypothetical protein
MHNFSPPVPYLGRRNQPISQPLYCPETWAHHNPRRLTCVWQHCWRCGSCGAGSILGCPVRGRFSIGTCWIRGAGASPQTGKSKPRTGPDDQVRVPESSRTLPSVPEMPKFISSSSVKLRNMDIPNHNLLVLTSMKSVSQRKFQLKWEFGVDFPRFHRLNPAG